MNGADEAHAHWQISSLLALYYQALDKGDLKTLELEVIAEDAIWEVVQLASIGRVEERVEGRDQVITWFKQMLSGNPGASEGALRHFIGTHVIRIDPSGRAARSTSHLLGVDTVTMATRVNGFVEAEHVRSAKGWRIRFCKIEERLTDEDMAFFKAAFELA